MRSFALELGDVDVALDELGLPHRWEPFDAPHVGATIDERKQHVATAMQRLASAHLLERDGRMDADVENTLRVWTSPDVLIMVRVDQTAGQRRLLYRAASAQDAGVVSQLVDERIQFEIVRGQRMLATMIGELPPFDPVPGLREVTVSTGASNEVAEEDFDPLSAEAPAGTAAAQQREMRAFAQWPVERFCGFELWVRGRSGLTHMGTAQVVDTEGGRYVMLPAENRDLRIVPSDGSHLQKWLRQRIDLGQDDR